MWCGIQVFVSLLLVLIVGIASAFPLPPDASSYRASASTSPRISCTTLDNGLACRKFQVPIVHRKATIPSLQVPLLDTSTWPSSLVEEDREIQRIMDVKIAKVQHSERVQHNERKPWSIPDVQVVLWFIILCCLTEGIVMGFRWWRGETKIDVKHGKPEQTTGNGGLGKVDEEDEDDEANIPVL